MSDEKRSEFLSAYFEGFWVDYDSHTDTYHDEAESLFFRGVTAVDAYEREVGSKVTEANLLEKMGKADTIINALNSHLPPVAELRARVDETLSTLAGGKASDREISQGVLISQMRGRMVVLEELNKRLNRALSESPVTKPLPPLIISKEDIEGSVTTDDIKAATALQVENTQLRAEINALNLRDENMTKTMDGQAKWLNSIMQDGDITTPALMKLAKERTDLLREFDKLGMTFEAGRIDALTNGYRCYAEQRMAESEALHFQLNEKKGELNDANARLVNFENHYRVFPPSDMVVGKKYQKFEAIMQRQLQEYATSLQNYIDRKIIEFKENQ